MKKIKLGIIGTGAIAEHHMRVLSSFRDVDVRAAANRSRERREQFCAKYHIPAHYEDYRKMLAHEDIDALYILVSAENMFSVTKECLKRNIPLFIEKPPGLYTHETRELVKLAQKRDTSVMVGLNRRFYSVIQQAKKAIEVRGPLLGLAVEAPEWIEKVKAARKFSKNVIKRWGVVNGMHMIDLIRFFGGDVRHVSVLRRAFKEKNGDNFGALLRFKNKKTIGQYSSHWHSPGRWKIDLYGNNIRAHIEPLEKGVLLRDGSPVSIIKPTLHDKKFKPGFWAENRYFINRVRDKKPITYPASSIADALKTMELVEKIIG